MRRHDRIVDLRAFDVHPTDDVRVHTLPVLPVDLDESILVGLRSVRSGTRTSLVVEVNQSRNYHYSNANEKTREDERDARMDPIALRTLVHRAQTSQDRFALALDRL